MIYKQVVGMLQSLYIHLLYETYETLPTYGKLPPDSYHALAINIIHFGSRFTALMTNCGYLLIVSREPSTCTTALLVFKKSSPLFSHGGFLIDAFIRIFRAKVLDLYAKG